MQYLGGARQESLTPRKYTSLIPMYVPYGQPRFVDVQSYEKKYYSSNR